MVTFSNGMLLWVLTTCGPVVGRETERACGRECMFVWESERESERDGIVNEL